jgi:uncharacterized membrane protein
LNLIRVMPAKGQDIMGNSIFLAKLIGPVFLAGAIGMFFNRDAYAAMAREFLHSPPLIYLSGLLTMLAGVALVLTHNIWVADWRVLITLFGWLAAMGGAIRIIWPAQVRSLGETMLRNPLTLTIGGAVWLAIGALLCVVGYF